MDMNLYETPEFDRLIEHLEYTVKSLKELYLNIDCYDRHSASAIIATNAGMVQGIILRLNELKE
jgi:hypothetical protein